MTFIRLNLIICFTLITFSSFSQVGYEKGYFINHQDQKTECLIRNAGWLNNPYSFKYIINAGDEPKEAFLADVKEFTVSDARYVRATVEIDRSSDDTRKLSNSSNPEWRKEDLFLKVLTEGKADLFYYRGKGIERFFFRTGASPIKQLEYKLFLNANGATRTNTNYLNQLRNYVSCGDDVELQLKKMRYSQPQLVRYFQRYNTCSGEAVVSEDTNNKSEFHLKLAPGLDYAGVYLENSNGYPTRDFPKKPSFRAGVEAELMLPFNKNKWSILVEPTFQMYKSDDPLKIEYTSIEVPFGVRHYLYLNQNWRAFANPLVVFDFPSKYRVEWTDTNTIEAKKARINLALGAGIAYKKFSLELRYYTKRTELDETNSWFLDYTKSTAILGYRLF